MKEEEEADISHDETDMEGFEGNEDIEDMEGNEDIEEEEYEDEAVPTGPPRVISVSEILKVRLGLTQ